MLLFVLPALALAPPTPGQPGESAIVGPAFFQPALVLPPEATQALIQRDYTLAAQALDGIEAPHGDQVADLALVLAWARLRTGDDEAVARSLPDLDVIRQAEDAPADVIELVVGELLLANEQAVPAAEALQAVPEDSPLWPRAQLALAQAWQVAGSTAQAVSTWQQLTDDDGAGPIALMALADKAGAGSAEAYPYLRRLWVEHPRSRQGREAEKRLASYEAHGSRYRPSRAEVAAHGTALMEAWAFKPATDYLGARVAMFEKPDAASCEAWYVLGRSHYKRNNITKAAEVLIPTGERCAGIDDDRGAKALYIAGKALERKKLWSDAARAYERIPALYPQHSMADDGYALAGIAWQIAGQPERALPLWTAQVEAYPEGDLAAEGFWRLAWSAYLAGDTDAAIGWADRMIWEVPLEADPVHGMAGRYWAARWRAYPSYDDPTATNPDAEQLALGIEQLSRLCAEHPTRFYAILAASRLAALAPDQLSSIPRPVSPPPSDTWTVRAAFLDDPVVSHAFALARLGLVGDALAELRVLHNNQLTPSELALITGLDAQRDPVEAHDRLHHFLLHHPPSTLTVDRDHLLRVSYPDLYWDEVQAAASEVDWDPRVFHALVREESSFNKDIVSFAGARGLSQLMPATARGVAAQLGLRSPDLFDPETNLRIGATYLDGLVQQYDGDLFLAVAGYNAGPGNVGKWLRANPDRPTDEWIESIPLRETRGYVKRVLGTWQLYHVLYDPGPLFPDLSRFNDAPLP